MNLEKLLISSANKFNVEITKPMVIQFMRYKELILQWNKNINLTAITDEKEIILKHFIDSITVVQKLQKNNNLSIIDIGTGAGLPGIPIKIVKPNYKVTLLDSLNKRIKFLETVIEELKLTNIEAIHGRSEDYGKNINFRENYDIAISRAVANMSTLCEYTLPFVNVGGSFIALKGASVEKELEIASKAINILGGTIKDINYINIPNTDIKHSIVTISKISHTPSKYPRNPSKIKISPIIV